MPEFIPYIPPEDLDIPEPTYTAITWPTEGSGTNTETARDMSLPGSQPSEDTHKHPDIGLYTPEETPEIQPPSREPSGSEHAGQNTLKNRSLGISELFAQGSSAADGPIAQETTVSQPPRRQRRLEPLNTAP